MATNILNQEEMEFVQTSWGRILQDIRINGNLLFIKYLLEIILGKSSIYQIVPQVIFYTSTLSKVFPHVPKHPSLYMSWWTTNASLLTQTPSCSCSPRSWTKSDNRRKIVVWGNCAWSWVQATRDIEYIRAHFRDFSRFSSCLSKRWALRCNASSPGGNFFFTSFQPFKRATNNRFHKEIL